MQIFSKNLFILIILSILSGYLFFYQLGGMALTDPDETFYGQTAKEMLERREWLTPYLYGKPQFEKPILFYWLVEASFKAFGVNEFAARLPSAILGLLGLIATYLLGGLLFNKRVGIFSSLILATNVEYIILSRACVTDMALGVLVLFGILFFFLGHIKRKGYFYLLASASFALATLTKGPIGILLPAIIITAYILINKEFKIFKSRTILWAVLIFFVLTTPWYLIMYRVHGKDFMDTFFGFHNITRFLEPEHEIGSQFYYYIPILFGGFFPWSAFLPYGFWHMFKKAQSSKLKAQSEGNLSVFILLWFLAIFIFFSVSRTKLPTYIFPAFPALALVVATLWDDFLKKDAHEDVFNGVRFSYYILLCVTAIGAIGLYIFIGSRYPSMLAGAAISGTFLIFGLVLSLTAFVNKKFLATFSFILYSVMLFLYPFSSLALPEIERYETSMEMSQELSRLIKGDEKIGSETDYVAGVTFYTGKAVTDVHRHDTLVKFLSSEKRVWVILKEKNHIQLYTLDTKPYYMHPSYMVYRLGKRCIITNKIPEDGRYLVKRERSM